MGNNIRTKSGNYLLRSVRRDALLRIMALARVGRISTLGTHQGVVVNSTYKWAGNAHWEVKQLATRSLIQLSSERACGRRFYRLTTAGYVALEAALSVLGRTIDTTALLAEIDRTDTDPGAKKCVDCDAPAVANNQPFSGTPEGRPGPKCQRHAGPVRLWGRPVESFIDRDSRVSGTRFGQAFKGTVLGTYTSRDGSRSVAIHTDDALLTPAGRSVSKIIAKVSDLTALDAPLEYAGSHRFRPGGKDWRGVVHASRCAYPDCGCDASSPNHRES